MYSKKCIGFQENGFSKIRISNELSGTKKILLRTRRFCYLFVTKSSDVVNDLVPFFCIVIFRRLLEEERKFKYRNLLTIVTLEVTLRLHHSTKFLTRIVQITSLILKILWKKDKFRS